VAIVHAGVEEDFHVYERHGDSFEDSAPITRS
jgi:hypothetical protein